MATPQLLLALKEHEIPARNLHGGVVYEMVERFQCKCGKQKVVSVIGARGRRRSVGCAGCLSKAPSTPHGWFKAYRFVPLNDPDFVPEDEPAIVGDENG